MEYTVLNAITLKGLIKDVNKKLAEGWKLQGGIAHGAGYNQAMIKE